MCLQVILFYEESTRDNGDFPGKDGIFGLKGKFPDFVEVNSVRQNFVSRRTPKLEGLMLCQLTRLVSLNCITSNAELQLSDIL